MLLDILHPHRLKRTESHVQGDLGDLNPTLPNPAQYLRSEMQSRRRSRHRAPILRIHSLITLAIVAFVRPRDVGWQRNVPYPFQALKKIGNWPEPDLPLAKISAPQHFHLQFAGIAKI